MKILVIENDFSVREALRLVLNTFGHETRLASNLVEALNSLDAYWPEVIVMDPTLPDADANQAYIEIHNRFGRVPPMVVLSSTQETDEPTLRVPNARVVPKPYQIEQLMDSIYELALGEFARPQYLH